MYNSLVVNIMVISVDETVKFYTEKLGFTLEIETKTEDGRKEWAQITKDNVKIMLHLKESMVLEFPTLANNSNPLLPTFSLFIGVSDVKAYYEEIKNKVKIASELHKTFYGTEEFAIEDNCGNILAFH